MRTPAQLARIAFIQRAHAQPGAAVDFLDMADAARTVREGQRA